MRANLRKMGNSQGVIIPQAVLGQVGMTAGGSFEMSLEAGEIRLRPKPFSPREGWADASKRIAQASDDALVWPEFGNDSDRDLIW